MTHEQDRPVDLLDHLLRARGVIRQGRQRILDGVERAVATPVQFDVDLRPMGRAIPETMDEHDVRGRARRKPRERAVEIELALHKSRVYRACSPAGAMTVTVGK
jgi:hypothetical protein